MKKIFIPLMFLILISNILNSEEQRKINSRDFAVLLSAETSENPPQIKIKWKNNELANKYQISRKAINDLYWGANATLDSGVTEYIDKNITPGVLYEYQVVALSKGSTGTDEMSFYGFGYILTGLNIKENDIQGDVLLLIDTTLKDNLKSEILRLKEDLRAEGWGIIEKYVLRTEKFNGKEVKKIKSIILDEYNNNKNLKSIFILGRVAVPYSGNMNPDGHPDHIGAWPSDFYYGYTIDEGFWTDNKINSTTASREENKNIPGDGKFDNSTQSIGSATLSVGRVDFYGMNIFEEKNGKSELDLLRNYLDKDHNYRNGEFEYINSGIIDDNFSASSYIEAFASSGWRNIAVLTSPESVKAADWFTTLSTESHLFAYGCGGGTYTSAGGIGKTEDFTNKNLNSVFTFLFGSYFGDWDSPNNFLRAPLASNPMSLISAWVGRPHWYFHHLAYGYSVGYSALISFNNSTLYKPNIVFTSQYPNGVVYTAGNQSMHTALMGDPTIKLNPAIVPSPINVSTYQQVDENERQFIKIKWDNPADNQNLKYNIYRSIDEFGIYEKINDNLISENEFIDNLNDGKFDRYDGDVFYMVRSVRKDTINSGIINNISRGEINKLYVTCVDENIDSKSNIKVNPNPANQNITIEFYLNSSGNTKIEIVDINGRVIYNLFEGFLSMGNQVASWNLRNESNSNVLSGIYFVRIVTPKQILVNQISIIN